MRVAKDVTQVAKLDSAIKSNDPKILQMELQGSIGTTVNQVGKVDVTWHIPGSLEFIVFARARLK